MGKSRPPEKNKLATGKRKKSAMNGKSKSPAQLLVEAVSLLHTSEPQAALQLATAALRTFRTKSDKFEQLPALSILGEICVELGDIPAAITYFTQAADIDADGDVSEERGGGPEKFFWLAQLSEEGGLDSVKWYQKGADNLRKQIASLAAQDNNEEAEALLDEQRVKLASALCSIAEIYMTDLSWDDKEAEEQCNKAMEEALSVAPDRPETLQTVASVRISQLKLDEAREHLRNSLELWKDLDPEDSQVPDFPTRISLSRLLMEAEMEDEANEVLERLVAEDDESVEAWYLGGWCLHLLAQRQERLASEAMKDSDEPGEDVQELLRRSRKWLQRCLRLCQILDYEDERLQEHASELVKSLNEALGGEEADNDSEDDYEGEGSEDEDAEMEGT
jgi:tetratricopeptide (TPR) repeat protein